MKSTASINMISWYLSVLVIVTKLFKDGIMQLFLYSVYWSLSVLYFLFSLVNVSKKLKTDIFSLKPLCRTLKSGQVFRLGLWVEELCQLLMCIASLWIITSIKMLQIHQSCQRLYTLWPASRHTACFGINIAWGFLALFSISSISFKICEIYFACLPQLHLLLYFYWTVLKAF